MSCNLCLWHTFSVIALVGAKPQEVLSLSKNVRSAVGGRRSGGTDHFGRPALEGQRSALAVGTFSKLFLISWMCQCGLYLPRGVKQEFEFLRLKFHCKNFYRKILIKNDSINLINLYLLPSNCLQEQIWKIVWIIKWFLNYSDSFVNSKISSSDFLFFK